MKIIILLFSLLVFSLMIVPQAYAAAGGEYTPTQPNAVASYDAIKNQIQVSWDFDTLPVDTTCLLKGDFWYYDDVNTNYSNESPSVTTYVPSFTPLYYSPVTATPVAIPAASQDGDYAEVVPCTGEMRIDMDTVMSHSQNINNFEDLQIFLTFYTPKSNGDFTTSSPSKYRIDEVFVFYTPIYTFDTGAKNYACGGQVGSTLYIDSTGIFGNNGDNCDQYLPLQSTQWVDIGMTDSGIKGKATYGFQSVSASPLKQVIVPTSEETPKKNGGGTFNPPPTLGVNKDGMRMVDNGFSYNGNTTNVERYHTPYPLITTEIIKNNTVEVIVYENSGINGIKWVQLVLGLKEISTPLSNGEVLGQLILSNGLFEEFNIIDKQNLVQNFNATSIEPIKCKETSNNVSCLKVTFEYQYRESPLYNVVAVDVMDTKRSHLTQYFNHGVKVIGESINIPLTDNFYHKSGNQHPMIKYDLKRTDKVNNIWTDQNGIEYYNNNGNYDRITPSPDYQCNDKPLNQIMNGGDRNNCHFRDKLPWLWQ